MQHFFVPHEQAGNSRIFITGEDVHHMKHALRMKSGEELMVSDGNNLKYLCRLKGYETGNDGAERAVLEIVRQEENDTELPSRIYLFQGLPKQDKMDLIVQKSVELGVYKVIPVAMRRSVVKLSGEKADKKRRRWQEIAKGAAKQSGRGLVPEIEKVLFWEEALKMAENIDVLLFPYELAEGISNTRQVIGGLRPGQSIGIFIGPEGGFEKTEAQEVQRAGAKAITLGKRILRTETAGIATLSMLMFQLEE
ncbi:MAG: 16S rRNA (uracil(1498)-N(3))-methyltransferase [Dorea sp.]|jgi:16S rRNA (uracil1498-N3)-methyltransferase|nr:16S rRNA (uracil(1498)-N(3))-methyltransferase [Dorea sp.]MCI9247602.1 16S rRNA (uracil(1498)-N(3))-methyltransferase [Dorea sp.]